MLLTWENLLIIQALTGLATLVRTAGRFPRPLTAFRPKDVNKSDTNVKYVENFYVFTMLLARELAIALK